MAVTSRKYILFELLNLSDNIELWTGFMDGPYASTPMSQKKSFLIKNSEILQFLS